MNPILVQQMARYKMDTFDREVEVDRMVGLAKTATSAYLGIGERVRQTAGRVRVIVRGAGA